MDGGRDDRRDSNRRKNDRRSDDRFREERRNSNRTDQRYDDSRRHGDDSRRRRDDHRQSEGNRNKNWTEGQSKSGQDESIVQQMSNVRLDDPESVASSLKKDMDSLSLTDRRDEKRGDHSVDGYSMSDRHNKRTKGSNEETESKKMKPEVRFCSRVKV